MNGVLRHVDSYIPGHIVHIEKRKGRDKHATNTVYLFLKILIFCFFFFILYFIFLESTFDIIIFLFFLHKIMYFRDITIYDTDLIPLRNRKCHLRLFCQTNLIDMTV